MNKIRYSIFSLSAAGLLAMSSCVVAPGPGGPPPPIVGVGVYDTLPGGWADPYYFYHGRYYYGGRWETGRYTWHGHAYGGRYYHNGHYYYGGRFDGGHHH